MSDQGAGADTPAPVAQPLSAEEEAQMRQWAADGLLGLNEARLLATLDAARSVPVSDVAQPLSTEDFHRLAMTLGYYMDEEEHIIVGGPSIAERVLSRVLADAEFLATLDAARSVPDPFDEPFDQTDERSDALTVREAHSPVTDFVRRAVAAEPELSWPGEIDSIIEDAERFEAEVDALLARMDEFAPNVRPSNPVYLRWLGLRIDLRAALASPEEPR